MDSKSLFLTANTDSIYNLMWLDTKEGPLVIETPPNVLGVIDDHWFQYVTDFGRAGPDKGKGGKFLLLPPGYKGEVPKGYFVTAFAQPMATWFSGRGFEVERRAPSPQWKAPRNSPSVYRLADAKNPPRDEVHQRLRQVAFNTVHANNFSFYEEVERCRPG